MKLNIQLPVTAHMCATCIKRMRRICEPGYNDIIKFFFLQ